jgi:protein TonB
LEIRKGLQKHFLIGFLLSAALHLLAVSTYHVVRLFEGEPDAPLITHRTVRYSELGPPPSIASASVPPPVSVVAAARPSVGTPVPVPDAEVSLEQTIATQQELSTAPSPATEDLAGGGEVEVTPDIRIAEEIEPDIDGFVPVEKEPRVVRRAVPVYPDMALRAQIEGTVWVKILVEKDGTPGKAVVVKSTSEIFEPSALEAAMQFLFTPGVMNQGPVRVWVAIPFRFTLKSMGPS